MSYRTFTSTPSHVIHSPVYMHPRDSVRVSFIMRLATNGYAVQTAYHYEDGSTGTANGAYELCYPDALEELARRVRNLSGAYTAV